MSWATYLYTGQAYGPTSGSPRASPASSLVSVLMYDNIRNIPRQATTKRITWKPHYTSWATYLYTEAGLGSHNQKTQASQASLSGALVVYDIVQIIPRQATKRLQQYDFAWPADSNMKCFHAVRNPVVSRRYGPRIYTARFPRSQHQ